MHFSLRRKINHKIRARRWVAYLLFGLLIMCFGFSFLCLAIMLLAPATVETLRSFHPGALAFTAFTAFLICGFWFYKGFKIAFDLLDSRDAELSSKLKEFVFHRSQKDERPSIVALGGGTGLSSLLKGLKEVDVKLTAVVTVSDDGGSSGRLRKDLQILPPGDIRNCLCALSKSESLLTKLFQYRFSEGGDMEGHSFGNLFIAAMTGVLGDFCSAVREASSILAIKGHVVPVTSDNVQLHADFTDGTEMEGETAICEVKKPIAKIKLVPENAQPNPEALSAIDDANMVILGPGSLYTSVIPNLLLPEVVEHINKCNATVVYICNVMTQPGETDGFRALDHVKTILDKTGLTKLDVVIVNSRQAAKHLMTKYEAKNQYWVPPTVRKIEELGIRVVATDLLSESDLLRHNPNTLAGIIANLVNEKGKNTATIEEAEDLED